MIDILNRSRISCHFDENSLQYIFKNEDTGKILTDPPSSNELKQGAILHDWSETPSQMQNIQTVDSGDDDKNSILSDTNISWIRDYDDEEDQFYYKHIVTKKLILDLPPNKKFIDIDNPKLKQIIQLKKEKYYNNQRTFSNKIPLWVKHFDQNNGKYFYENTRTNKISWVEPQQPFLWIRSNENSENENDLEL